MYTQSFPSLSLWQVVECEDEQPIPAEEEPPSPPSPPREPSPVTHADAPMATPSSPTAKQRRSKRKKRRKRPQPVGGTDEEGENGRSDGVGEGGEEENESADELEFHDAHSELPGTLRTCVHACIM